MGRGVTFDWSRGSYVNPRPMWILYIEVSTSITGKREQIKHFRLKGLPYMNRFPVVVPNLLNIQWIRTFTCGLWNTAWCMKKEGVMCYCYRQNKSVTESRTAGGGWVTIWVVHGVTGSVWLTVCLLRYWISATLVTWGRSVGYSAASSNFRDRSSCRRPGDRWISAGVRPSSNKDSLFLDSPTSPDAPLWPPGRTLRCAVCPPPTFDVCRAIWRR